MPDIFRLTHDVSMSATEQDTAEVMLYGAIIKNMPNEYKWDEEDKSAIDFDKAIKQVRKDGAKNLSLRINSPGGVCTEAVAIRSIIVNAGFEKINISIEGLCASAATMIASIPEAHVSIMEGSEYMIHNPWLTVQGNANDLEHVIQRLRNIEETSRAFYSMKSKQSDEQIKEWMDAETWFTAEEAVEYGFADELVSASSETDIAACVSSEVMAAMQGMYKSVPKQVRVSDKAQEQEEPAEEVTDGIPVAGEPSEINKQEEENPMELKDLTIEQLSDGNPALVEEIKQAAIEAERTRLSDIEALTIPGYEEMAETAKAEGTSAMDFQKQVVAAMKQKGAEFMAARKEETEPAQEVKGGEPADNAKSEADEIAENAKAMADLAKEINANGNIGGMF